MAIALNDKDFEPYLALAVALYMQGDRNESFKLAERASQLDKRSFDLQYLKKEKYWSDRLLEDAMKFFNDPKIQAIMAK